MSEPERFPWTGRLAVGVEEIDAQHKVLFELASLLHAAIAIGKGERVAASAFSALARYIAEHFRDEEAQLERRGARGLSRHRQAHAALTIELDSLRVSGGPGFTAAKSTDLERWVETRLVPHVQRFDSVAFRADPTE